MDPDGCWSFGWFENPLGNLALIAAEACAAATIIGWGIAGVAEGFLAGCSAGISGTAVDLALDAAALYSEGGMAICAAAEGSTISYNVCKTIGRVAGAAFSCTPAGKVTQSTLCTAKMGMSVVNTTSKVAQAGKAIKNSKKIAETAKEACETIRKSDGTIEIANKVTGYTKHGLNQAIGRNEGRGVSPKAILNALKNPKKCIEHPNNVMKYVGEEATVLVNSEKKIITTFGAKRGPQLWTWGKEK